MKKRQVGRKKHIDLVVTPEVEVIKMRDFDDTLEIDRIGLLLKAIEFAGRYDDPTYLNLMPRRMEEFRLKF